MRTLLVVAAAALVASCSGKAQVLPSMDGAGPLQGAPSGGSSGGSATTSSSGGTPAPTSSGQPTPAPGVDAGGATGGASEDAGSGPVVTPDASPGDAGAAPRDSGSPTDGGSVAALRALCVNDVNQFREQNGAPAYGEASDLDAYAATAAASDAQTGTRHGYFYQTNGGGGVAATEDELDGAMVAPGEGAQQTLEQGLQQDEQAQGAAAANLLDQQFSQVGCGFAQDGGGNWWVVIALR